MQYMSMIANTFRSMARAKASSAEDVNVPRASRAEVVHDPRASRAEDVNVTRASREVVVPCIRLTKGNVGSFHREMVVLPKPADMLWPSENISFFKSTGTSNEHKEENTSTYFPMFGIIRESGNYPTDKPKLTRGHIIKIGTLFLKQNGTSQEWIDRLVTSFFERQYPELYPWIIKTIEIDISNLI